jgi:hypothetical protein
MARPACPLAFVLVLLALVPRTLAAGAAGAPVHVSTGAELAAAFGGDARRIVLDRDVAFSPADWPGGVHKLTRNLTVTSDLAGPHRVRERAAWSGGGAPGPAARLWPDSGTRGAAAAANILRLAHPVAPCGRGRL